jgi:superfamily II DNA helicase RecQ
LTEPTVSCIDLGRDTKTMNESKSWATADILAAVRRYWGYTQLRPLQERAIHAELEHRDSLVVMPTGGGKSLCYQVSAELAKRTDIVVSSLISLMKDQVDGLRECGYPAAALHGGMPAHALRETEPTLRLEAFNDKRSRYACARSKRSHDSGTQKMRPGYWVRTDDAVKDQ